MRVSEMIKMGVIGTAGNHILVDVGLTASRLDTLLLGLGQLLDVAVHRVLEGQLDHAAGHGRHWETYEDNSNLGSHGDGVKNEIGITDECFE